MNRFLVSVLMVLGVVAATAKPTPRAAARPVAKAKIVVVKSVTSCTVTDRGYAANLAEKTHR